MLSFLLFAIVSAAHAQVDGGLFGIQQKINGNWVDVGWLSADNYDPPGSPPPEDHEHWYLNSSFSADNLTRRFRYYGAPLAEDKRPVDSMTGWTYFLYRYQVPPALTYVSAPSNTSDPTCNGAQQNLCTGLVYAIKQSSSGPVVGYVNVFSTGSPAAIHENYMLGSWLRANATNCLLEWIVDPYDNNTGLGSDDGKALLGTSIWGKNWLVHDPNASVPGTYQAPPGSPASCP